MNDDEFRIRQKLKKAKHKYNNYTDYMYGFYTATMEMNLRLRFKDDVGKFEKELDDFLAKYIKIIEKKE